MFNDCSCEPSPSSSSSSSSSSGSSGDCFDASNRPESVQYRVLGMPEDCAYLNDDEFRTAGNLGELSGGGYSYEECRNNEESGEPGGTCGDAGCSECMQIYLTKQGDLCVVTAHLGADLGHQTEDHFDFAAAVDPASGGAVLQYINSSEQENSCPIDDEHLPTVQVNW